jgi:hypothetical protein
MKGTIQEITKQESGFVIYPHAPGSEKAILDNWSSDLTEYKCDKRKTRKVKSCLAYIENLCGRDYDGELQYVQYANPVTEDDLRVPGSLYKVDGFLILAPKGWA